MLMVRCRGAALNGDLEHTVLEAGAYLALIYALGQGDAPPEGAVEAFADVVAHLCFARLARAFPRDGQHAVGERDVDVFPAHARELGPDDQVSPPSEYVRGRHPGGNVGPLTGFLSGLEVLPHPVHLAHRVYESPERVPPRLANGPSFSTPG